jgi:hypothetical protein
VANLILLAAEASLTLTKDRGPAARWR